MIEPFYVNWKLYKTSYRSIIINFYNYLEENRWHHFSIYLRNKGYSVDAVLLFSATVSIFLAAVGIGLFLGLISLASALLFAGSGFIVACYFIFSPPKSFVNKKNISLQPSKIIKNKINIFEKEGPRLR